MNDNELLSWLEKAKLGDESAFQLVYQATHQDVYRTVAFLVYNKQDIEDIELKGRDRYRPYVQLITSITTGISAILGLARGAVEYFVEKAPHKGITMTIHTSQAAVGHIQYKVGLAAMKVESAHLHISRAIDHMEQHVQNAEIFNLKELAQLQTDMTYAAMLCWEAVDMLMAESGGSVIADSNRLSQIFRDIRGGSNHALTTASTGLELYGRVLLGLPPQHGMTLAYVSSLRTTTGLKQTHE